MAKLQSFIAAMILLCAATASADQQDLLFGMSTALSGPAQDLGIYMQHGVLTAFDRTNREGGINGRKLKLLTLDDGYEPDRTGPNMRKLIREDRVLGIIGNVGTPTAIVSIPIALEHKTLFFAAFTGAGILRKTPPDRYVINYRASYAEETGFIIDGLLGELKLTPEDIAFFTQRDGYGDAGFAGGVAALLRHGYSNEKAIVHTRYERNTVAIENAVADLIGAPHTPKAVVMVGAYAPCARLIKVARESGLSALFINVSFVGSTSLARELGTDGQDVLITQVVPPLSAGEPIVKEFISDLKNAGFSEDRTFGSLEGYIAGRILSLALSSPQARMTREGVVDALESLGTFSLGTGSALSLGPADHQASDKVWLTTIDRGDLKMTSWQQVARLRSVSRKGSIGAK